MPLDFPNKPIEAYCRRWKITELAVFGSALREDFHDESDVDVLITFSDDARWGLFDLVSMQNELEDIVGRKVDLVERQGIERSHNPIRRKAILRSARPIYQAA